MCTPHRGFHIMRLPSKWNGFFWEDPKPKILWFFLGVPHPCVSENLHVLTKHEVYPLVICYIAIENHQMFYGKKHYKEQFSIAMFVSQRVFVVTSMSSLAAALLRRTPVSKASHFDPYPRLEMWPDKKQPTLWRKVGPLFHWEKSRKFHHSSC